MFSLLTLFSPIRACCMKDVHVAIKPQLKQNQNAVWICRNCPLPAMLTAPIAFQTCWWRGILLGFADTIRNILIKDTGLSLFAYVTGFTQQLFHCQQCISDMNTRLWMTLPDATWGRVGDKNLFVRKSGWLSSGGKHCWKQWYVWMRALITMHK